MTSSRTPPYTHRADIEDLLALLGSIDDRRKCILVHAFHWHPGADDAIFDEAKLMGEDVRRLQETMRRCWCQIQSFIDEGGR